jgi:hypothetical protein
VSGEYAEGKVQQLLAEDPRTNEQGIRVSRCDDGFVLSGEVECAERRDVICAVVSEAFPDAQIQCDIGLTKTREPDDVEEI